MEIKFDSSRHGLKGVGAGDHTRFRTAARSFCRAMYVERQIQVNGKAVYEFKMFKGQVSRGRKFSCKSVECLEQRPEKSVFYESGSDDGTDEIG